MTAHEPLSDEWFKFHALGDPRWDSFGRSIAAAALRWAAGEARRRFIEDHSGPGTMYEDEIAREALADFEEEIRTKAYWLGVWESVNKPSAGSTPDS